MDPCTNVARQTCAYILAVRSTVRVTSAPHIHPHAGLRACRVTQVALVGTVLMSASVLIYLTNRHLPSQDTTSAAGATTRRYVVLRSWSVVRAFAVYCGRCRFVRNFADRRGGATGKGKMRLERKRGFIVHSDLVCYQGWLRMCLYFAEKLRKWPCRVQWRCNPDKPTKNS